MRILGGLCLVIIGVLVMIYGSENVISPQSGGTITKLFSSANKPGGALANRVMSWVLGIIIIGFGLSLLVGDFPS
jgi:hypothetical protein